MMKKMMFVVSLAALLLSTAAMAVPQIVDLSYFPGFYQQGDIIQIPQVDEEMLYIHVNWPAHVDFLSFHPVVQGTAIVEMKYYEIYETMNLVPSQWYPYGVVRISGVPSTLITISVDINGVESNTITKHITPEPSAFLALGTGVLGIGGLLLRRRR